ncbi:MAG: hypothetical protein CVV05_01610 [Gammaproteobacteria bacterium HGW-Gammaproteobacteria-1]|jgi:hypothetical protein|nr:MAG: hypothetical protein CVV05_01610 [Gammaproteobacteria bacterium HGW-Gammaproteobacteria-1]
MDRRLAKFGVQVLVLAAVLAGGAVLGSYDVKKDIRKCIHTDQTIDGSGALGCVKRLSSE